MDRGKPLGDWERKGGAKSGVEKRLARVLQILRFIQEEPRQWTRERMVQHFGMSSRQLDNDLRLLRAVGHDIKRHRDGYAIHQEEKTE